MFANERCVPFSLVHYWKWYIFHYPTIFFPPFKTKSAATEVYRTEKRKLQLSPNKTNFTDKHHMQVSGASAFAWFHLTRKNRYRYKTPYKNRAFILKSYLVLFGIFIISHFLQFVNMFDKIYIITFQEVIKSLLCVKGGGTACRDGGIVKKQKFPQNNPSAAFGVSSLYTREPFLCSSILRQFSWQALHLCPQTQNTAYLFRDIPYSCKTVL